MIRTHSSLNTLKQGLLFLVCPMGISELKTTGYLFGGSGFSILESKRLRHCDGGEKRSGINIQ